MALHSQMVERTLAKAVLAFATLLSTSSSMCTVFDSVLPRYVNLSTTFRLDLCTLMGGFNMLLSWCWLVHYFGLLYADGKPKVVKYTRKVIHVVLHVWLWSCIQGSVFSKKQVSDNSRLWSLTLAQSSEVEELPICVVSNTRIFLVESIH